MKGHQWGTTGHTTAKQKKKCLPFFSQEAQASIRVPAHKLHISDRPWFPGRFWHPSSPHHVTVNWWSIWSCRASALCLASVAVWAQGMPSSCPPTGFHWSPARASAWPVALKRLWSWSENFLVLKDGNEKSNMSYSTLKSVVPVCVYIYIWDIKKKIPLYIHKNPIIHKHHMIISIKMQLVCGNLILNQWMELLYFRISAPDQIGSVKS